MLEVRAVGGAFVLDDMDREIPGDQFITVERTPHIMNAIRAGDLERRDKPSEAYKASDPTVAQPEPAAQSEPAESQPPITLRETAAPCEQELALAASPSKREENETAIELASKELKRDPELKRAETYELLFGPKNKRALALKEKVWVTGWTPSRFRLKVWKRARERADLDVRSRKGRRPEK
jgi:hypothetical protein